METRTLTAEHIQKFRDYLYMEEKSTATLEKYIRDVRTFFDFTAGRTISKELVMEYKNRLIEKGYAVCSVNSMLASLNSLLNLMGWSDCKVKNIKFQRKTYCSEKSELNKADYMKLLRASGQNPRLNLIMQTICGTGIRVSELRYFTVEALKKGEVTVRCKNKTRTILIPGKLKKLLLHYIRKNHISSGTIFITQNGKPVNRSNIWKQMKELCGEAGVLASKVFPHNLRKLFARTFYGMEKDIAKLADILGHGSIETTRIYIITTGEEHRQKMEMLGLVVGEGSGNECEERN